MEQIRVNRGIEIGVNDNGDSIFLDVENIYFVDRFKEMLNKLEEVSAQCDKIAEDSQMDAVDFQVDAMKEITEEIDKFIGADTCKKVFGEDVLPTVYAVADFFMQLIPIVSKYTNARDERILKEYNPNRRGAKK